MITTALALSLFLQQPQIISRSKTDLPNLFGGPSRLSIIFDPENRLSQPKKSPKKFGDPPTAFEFDYFTGGYANPFPQQEALQLRFRVYEQQRKVNNDVAFAVTEMLLRLWEYDYFRLGLDHVKSVNHQLVDVYLCWGGNPGGEQLFDEDKSMTPSQTVNSIYIYDLPSFKDPVEMAREVAHEYGHAAMPAIGGFKTPEDWGNGFFGEKLYLLYLRDQMAAGKLVPQDAMGATLEDLNKWIAKNVDPLMAKAASAPPNVSALGGQGQEAMNAYMGLYLYLSRLLPDKEFSQALVAVGDTSAKSIPDAVQMAINRPGEQTMTVPTKLVGKPIWVPIGHCRVLGAAISETQNGWGLIKSSPASFKLVGPPDQA